MSLDTNLSKPKLDVEYFYHTATMSLLYKFFVIEDSLVSVMEMLMN